MTSTTDKITFLTNWRGMPYHAPVFLAQIKGYFAQQGIKVALLQPTDPSDVTEIIGSGKADMGLKAMIHTLAGKARGHPIKSVGTLLDEPLTGVVYLKSSGIQRFEDLKGRRIGYVGEFGKIQIDALMIEYGMAPSDYEAVRCGMDVTRAIQKGEVDAGIGLENVQMVDLEEWCKANGGSGDDVQMLRIDALANLGCCCFCSILYITNEAFLARNPDKVRRFMKAVKLATDDLIRDPRTNWALCKDRMPELDSPLQGKIFERSFVYLSRDLNNVQRDWAKVTAYSKRLQIITPDFKPNYTNEFLTWPADKEVEDPEAKQCWIVNHQKEVAAGQKGVLSY